MTGYSNKERASDGRRVLLEFMVATQTEEESAVRDLLASIMHYCNQSGIDFDYELSMATDFYGEELDQEAEVNRQPKSGPSCTM